MRVEIQESIRTYVEGYVKEFRMDSKSDMELFETHETE